MTTKPLDHPAWHCLKDLRQKWRWKTEWQSWNGFVWKCGIPQNGNFIAGNDDWMFDHQSWCMLFSNTHEPHPHSPWETRWEIVGIIALTRSLLSVSLSWPPSRWWLGPNSKAPSSFFVLISIHGQKNRPLFTGLVSNSSLEHMMTHSDFSRWTEKIENL